MAQDLSQTIQEGLAQTLTDLLGVDAKFLETTKVDRRDIQSIQLLQVNAEFEYDKITTIFKFMIPAPTASIIFNTMMGASDFEISNTIDDDTSDAMGEFISNVSGSLVTAFNAQDIEELGKAKFNIQHKEIIEGSSIESIETLFRFLINLDENPLTIFTEFSEDFLPFISEIAASEPTYYPEEELPSPQETPTEISPQEDSSLETEDPSISNDAPDEQEQNDQSKDNEDTEEEIVDEQEQKKSKKMKLLIIILSSLIGLVIIVFLAILLLSTPDEEELEKQEEVKSEMSENNEEKTEEPKQEEITIKATKTLKKIDFKMNDIDIGRLNSKLATLTKYEILTKEELELQKKEEEKRLLRLKKEEELKEFAKRNKEEPVAIKQTEQNKPTLNSKTDTVSSQNLQQQTMKKNENENTQRVMQPTTTINSSPQKLLFVFTNSIKYTLFKSLIPQTNSNSARISMCNDKDGRTTILIGPFETTEQQVKMDQLIKNSKNNISTTLDSISQEAFNQRCDF